MRSVAIGFSAAADARPFLVDRKTTLSWVHAGIKSVISNDPNSTVANVITAPQNISLNNLIFVGAAIGAYFVDYPLEANETVFISGGGAGQIVLFFSDSVL